MSGEGRGDMERRPSKRVHPSVIRVLASTGARLRIPNRTMGSFKSLDRSLKAFLRTSNLPGLEYRLRVAGFNTLEDLAETDEDILCSHGFTPLMARRLLAALEEYVMKQLYKQEGKQLPFQLVRKGQKIDSTPTDKMKELPTYGKQNVKRQRNPDKKSTKNVKKGEILSKVRTVKRPVSVVRLMSEETIPTEPVFPNVSVVQEAAFEVLGTEEEDEEERARSPNSPSFGERSGSESYIGGARPSSMAATGLAHSPLIQRHSPPPESTAQAHPPGARRGVEEVALSMPHVDYRASQMFQEFYVPDQVDAGPQDAAWEGMKKQLQRSQSIPADFHFFSDKDQAHLCEWGLVGLFRSYSSPSSLTTSAHGVECLLAELSANDNVDVVLRLLQRLLGVVRDGGVAAGREGVGGGGAEVLLEVLGSLCTHPVAVETILRILKHLTRLGDVVPAEEMGVVFDAMDCHPTSKVVLTQACLVLGNIGRTGPVECAVQLVSDRNLVTVSQAFNHFPSSVSLLVSAMAMLGVGLGRCTPDDRLRLVLEHGKILDLVVLAMSSYPSHAQLLSYASSFIALLIAEIAVCLESGVMELLVASVCQAANCCSSAASGDEPSSHGNPSGEGDEVALMVWICKALANSASNAAFNEDSKLAGRCIDVLLEALSLYPHHTQVWMCSLYAILQILNNNNSIREYLVRSNLLVLLKTPPTSLPREAECYMEQLHHHLTAV